MPKVTTYKAKYKDLNNNDVLVNEPVNVDTDGDFSIAIPEALQEYFLVEYSKSRSSTFFISQRFGSRPHLRAKSLAAVTGAYCDLLKSYSSPSVFQELVILYRISGRASVFRSDDGTLHQNGEGTHSGRWVEFRHARSGNDWLTSFGVDIFACVAVKVTTTRGSYINTEYQRASVSRDAPDAKEAPGAMLNRFILGLSSGDRSKMTEIPYTKKAEVFFTNAILSVCSIAADLEAFGADKEAVEFAIETGSMSLLGNKKPREIEQ